ncbi:MAG TPA: hypothetical protein VF614_09175, partial [Chthoniobacteraceae bacterium]
DKGSRLVAIRQSFSVGARPESNTAALDFWLFTRLSILSKERLAAKEEWCRSLVDIAQHIWESAAAPGDLKPALAALNEIKHLEPSSWGMLAQNGPSSGGWMLHEQPIPVPLGEAFYLWMVMSAPEPLLLPDPAVAPAKALVAWERWAMFREEQRRQPRPWVILGPRQASLIESGRFDRAFRLYQGRLVAAAVETWKQLNQLIVSKAPVAVFEASLEGARIFALADAPRGAPVRRPPGLNGSGIGGFPGRSDPFNRQPVPRPAGLSHGPLTAYDKWLAWLRAEESGDSQTLARARSELLPVLARLPSAALIHVRLPPPQPQPQEQETLRFLAAAGHTAIDRLTSTLLHLAKKRDGSEVEAIVELARNWQEWSSNPGAQPSARQPQSNAGWLAVAQIPGSGTVFALREAASRELFEKTIGGAVPVEANALGSVLEAVFEQQLTARAWPRAEHLLSLAELSGTPVAAGIPQSRRLIEFLRIATAPDGVASSTEARDACISILAKSESRAAVGIAAARL